MGTQVLGGVEQGHVDPRGRGGGAGEALSERWEPSCQSRGDGSSYLEHQLLLLLLLRPLEVMGACILSTTLLLLLPLDCLVGGRGIQKVFSCLPVTCLPV